MANIHCYFDETKFKINDVEYLALAGVFIKDENLSDISSILTKLKEDLESDQFLGRSERNRIFHFTEDNQDIQPKVIECLRKQNLRVYIAFKKIENGFQNTYNKIIVKILFDRFQKYHLMNFIINYEENNQIKPTKLISAINLITIDIQKTKTSFQNPSINKVTKKELLNVLPDYFLGVFRQYNIPYRKEFMGRNFEKFRKKIRLVVDMDNHQYYHRGNPYIIEEYSGEISQNHTFCEQVENFFLLLKRHVFRFSYHTKDKSQ